MSNKQCKECLNLLPLSQFTKDKNYSDGHRNDCKECRSLKSQQYYKRNKEAVKAKKRAYYKANSEMLIANDRERYRANPAKRLAIVYNWMANNREHHSAWRREYRKKTKLTGGDV